MFALQQLFSGLANIAEIYSSAPCPPTTIFFQE